MDGAYAHLAACYKRTTDHCIAELNGCLTPGAWLKSSCLAGCFFQESLIIHATKYLKAAINGLNVELF